jgi:cell division protein FtsW
VSAHVSNRADASPKPWLQRPLTLYYLILASSLLLVGLGLAMVWSSSFVTSYSKTGSSFAVIEKQAMWVAAGLPLMWFASRMQPRFFRVLAYPLLAFSLLCLMLVLIPGFGANLNGATRWINLGGPLRFQPSEIAKVALLLWGADLLARKKRMGTLFTYRHLLIPLLPGAGLTVLLVIAGSDLGTTMVLLTILLSLLWTIGAPLRLFAALVGVMVAGVTALAVFEPYRMQRLLTFADPFKDPHGTGWQASQGLYALASGRWWGVGLGGSREKWGYLPQAHNDFIFAIIGEELGLVGTLGVLALFATLAYAGIRVAQRSRDTFSKLAAAAVVAWLLMQALVNIGAVIGMLPITGIPLPLISAGGSSLLPTMFALGMLMALARREPQAAAALAARGPGRVRRTAARLRFSRSAGPVM